MIRPLLPGFRRWGWPTCHAVAHGAHRDRPMREAAAVLSQPANARIIYLDLGFDLHVLDKDLLPNLPLFGGHCCRLGQARKILSR